MHAVYRRSDYPGDAKRAWRQEMAIAVNRQFLYGHHFRRRAHTGSIKDAARGGRIIMFDIN